MAKRPQIKVRPGKPLDALLQATGGYNSPTMRLNAVAERYLAMIETARPSLTDHEWFAICDANNGYGTMEEIEATSGYASWSGIWQNVADTPELGEKWGIDQEALIRELRGMSEHETIAVAETIQRFWAHSRMEGHAALKLARTNPTEWFTPDNDWEEE